MKPPQQHLVSFCSTCAHWISTESCSARCHWRLAATRWSSNIIACVAAQQSSTTNQACIAAEQPSNMKTKHALLLRKHQPPKLHALLLSSHHHKLCIHYCCATITFKMACLTAEQDSTTNIAWSAGENPVINHNKHALLLNSHQLQNKHALLLNNHQLQKQAYIAAEKSSTT